MLNAPIRRPTSVALVAFLLLAVSVFASLSSAQNKKLEALTQLKIGNLRYVSGKIKPKNYTADRKATAEAQHPYAIVLACADSRVPPEILFDESIGRLFVIRVAGNVVDPVVLGSIEYAAEHLHVDTLLILGHESCGAVKAALAGGDAPPNIKALVERIAPAVEAAKQQHLNEQRTVNYAISRNVDLQGQHLIDESTVLKQLIHEGKLRVLRGVYSLHSGKVDLSEMLFNV